MNLLSLQIFGSDRFTFIWKKIFFIKICNSWILWFLRWEYGLGVLGSITDFDTGSLCPFYKLYVLVPQFPQLDMTYNITNYKYLGIFLLQKELCKHESYLNLSLLPHCHLSYKEKFPRL